MGLDDWLERRVESLEAADRLRKPVVVERLGPTAVRVDGAELALFSGNDYLGLSSHPRVVAAAVEAAQQHGVGARGSALVCGRTSVHAELERALADLVGTEAALLLPSGWAANAGTLEALADDQLEIFSDALNHASLIDGCRLAVRHGALLRVYRHADLDHLEDLLACSTRPRRLIVTDSVFSMDGDSAPLAGLVALKRRHGAALMLDEAHATLIRGPRGAGLAEELGLEPEVDVHVGTLSKAVGSQGGFVAGSRALIDWLFNRNRSGVFSTALAVPTVAAALAALEVAADEPQWRVQLSANRKLFAGLAPGTAPIVPVILGTESRALAAAAKLRRGGAFVPAIRPPTVPAGTARLRITVSALHEPAQVADLRRRVGELLLGPADSPASARSGPSSS
jgi:8-amino-7-oxononanoate synthase